MAASLAAGGMTSDEIDVVILSHVHWDVCICNKFEVLLGRVHKWNRGGPLNLSLPNSIFLGNVFSSCKLFANHLEAHRFTG